MNRKLLSLTLLAMFVTLVTAGVALDQEVVQLESEREVLRLQQEIDHLDEATFASLVRTGRILQETYILDELFADGYYVKIDRTIPVGRGRCTIKAFTK